jgi:hypothetical protein
LAGGKKGGRVRQEYQQGTRVGLIYVLVLNAKISAGNTYRSNINNMTDRMHHYLMRCLGFVHTGAVLIC